MKTMSNTEILERVKNLTDASNRVMQGVEILQKIIEYGYGHELLTEMWENLWNIEDSLNQLKCELPYHFRPECND